MTRIRGSSALLIIMALSTLPPSPGATTVVAPLSIQELVDLSDLTIHGTVLSLDTFRDERHIFTRLDVSVTESLFGETPSSVVSVELYGGVHEGLASFVIGAPTIRLGEEVVLFLKAKRPDVYYIVALAEGKFSVVRGGGEPARVERDLQGIRYLDPEGPTIPPTLESLKAVLRAAARSVDEGVKE